MHGGTTFHFVADGIEAAAERAFIAADGADVRVGGGAATVQQYLRAGMIDEMHLAIVPILLGRGERLFDHLDGGPVGYEIVEFVTSAFCRARPLRPGVGSVTVLSRRLAYSPSNLGEATTPIIRRPLFPTPAAVEDSAFDISVCDGALRPERAISG